MYSTYKRRSNVAGLVCLVAAIGLAGTAVQTGGNIWDGGNTSAQVLLIVALAAWFYALASYAMAKGRSGWWALSGVLSAIGLLVLIALSDRTDKAS